MRDSFLSPLGTRSHTCTAHVRTRSLNSASSAETRRYITRPPPSFVLQVTINSTLSMCLGHILRQKRSHLPASTCNRIAHAEDRCVSQGVPPWSGSCGHPPPRRTAACPRLVTPKAAAELVRSSWTSVPTSTRPSSTPNARVARTYGKALLGLCSLLCLSVCGNLAYLRPGHPRLQGVPVQWRYPTLSGTIRLEGDRRTRGHRPRLLCGHRGHRPQGRDCDPPF